MNSFAPLKIGDSVSNADILYRTALDGCLRVRRNGRPTEFRHLHALVIAIAIAMFLGLTTSSVYAFPFRLVESEPLDAVQDQIYAAAWGDYNGDGRPDIYLSTLTGTDGVLLRNEVSGFVRVSSGAPSVANTARAGAVWIDSDNDGDLDLFVATTSGQPDFFHLNLGNGTFTTVSDVSLMTGSAFGQAVTVSDFNRDGRVDIFVANGGGNTAERNVLLQGVERGYFEATTGGDLTLESRNTSGSAAADFDGDGFVDLFVANIWGRNSLFRNSRDGRFERIIDSAPAPEFDPNGATTAAWGDWDNDGDFDLVVVNGQPFELFRNDGAGKFSKLPATPSVLSCATCSGAVIADFNNDGFPDILVARRLGSPLMYSGLGNGTFVPVINDPLVRHSSGANGLAIADYDLDGDLDVLLTNWNGQNPPALFRNQSTTNSWLRIRLVGSASQRDGVGARVRVDAPIRGTRTIQLRQIGGEDSQGAQELIAHFGLGDATFAERVVVEWPSGLTQEVSMVAARQLVTLIEPARPLLAIIPNGGTFTNQVAVTLFSGSPDAAIRYSLDGSEPDLASLVYSGPFVLARSTTVKARLFINGFPASETFSAFFRADPGVGLVPAGGDFTNRLDVVLTSRLAQTTLHYTVDGTDPTSASTTYQGPILITESTTLKAVAFFNNFPVSEIVSGTFRRVFVFGSDGISNAWREQYFGRDFRYDSRAHALSDPDRDGADNGQEFLAGSDPLDPTSGFRVEIRALPEIRFPAVPGVKYRILRRRSIDDPSPAILQETTASSDSIRFIDETVDASPNASFYLVEPVR